MIRRQGKKSVQRTNKKSVQRKRKTKKSIQRKRQYQYRFGEDDTIVDMIENDEYNDFPLNLLLVKYGARKAYLLETSEIQPQDVQKLLKIAIENGLHVEKDPLSDDNALRYLIFKTLDKIPDTDEELGTVLGFIEPGGNSGGTTSNITLRISEKTKKINITAEVILSYDRQEIEEFAQHKLDAFNKVMIHLNLPYRFAYEIEEEEGSLKRAEELKRHNMKYIIDNERAYVNDLNNTVDIFHPLLFLFSKVIHNKKLFSKYLPIFLYFYQIHNEEILEDERLGDKINSINEKFVDLLLGN